MQWPAEMKAAHVLNPAKGPLSKPPRKTSAGFENLLMAWLGSVELVAIIRLTR